MKNVYRFTGLLLLYIASLGCQNPKAEQLSGSELTTDSKGNQTLVTYVTPEEYDRMSPQERERLNAAVGARVSAGWGAERKKTTDVSSTDLDKAMENAGK